MTHSLDDRSTLTRRTISPSICSGEAFVIRSSGIGFLRGACAFGDFTEYRTVR